MNWEAFYMAFLDKLNSLAKNVGEKAGELAKNVGDKANDAIEATKLRAKIRAEEDAIAELYRKIGEYYYRKHKEGAAPDPGAEEMLYAVDGHNAVIAEANRQLDALREEPAKPAPAGAESAATVEAAPAEPAPAEPAPAEPAAAPDEPSPAENVCPACAAPIDANAKFCPACGAKL